MSLLETGQICHLEGLVADTFDELKRGNPDAFLAAVRHLHHCLNSIVAAKQSPFTTNEASRIRKLCYTTNLMQELVHRRAVDVSGSLLFFAGFSAKLADNQSNRVYAHAGDLAPSHLANRTFLSA